MNRREVTLSLGAGLLAVVTGQRKGRPRTIHMAVTITPHYANEPIVFHLTKPDTSIITTSLLTDSNGQGQADFPLGNKYVHGTYLGDVTVTVGAESFSDSAYLML